MFILVFVCPDFVHRDRIEEDEDEADEVPPRRKSPE